IRMYRPHEAREDTVLFPALHGLLSARQMRELGERFEQEEDRLFGEGGFQRIVGQVAEIERQLGVYDLAQFTPRLTGQCGSARTGGDRGSSAMTNAAALGLGALVLLVAVAAGAIASVAGFGIGSLLTPLLAWPLGTRLAVAAVSIPHLVGTALRFW